MKVTVVGSQKQKDKLYKEFDKDYDSFMYIYDDIHTPEGQSWFGVIADLCEKSEHTLSEYEQKEFYAALENFAAIIGDEFDLDLEYAEE